MRFTTDEIAACTGGEVVVQAREVDAPIIGLSWDSRTVGAGELYVALPGERVDGHKFVVSAFQAGAQAVLVAAEVLPEWESAARACGGAIVRVPNTFAALPLMARAWRNRLQGTVIALTGSSGKTTTKGMLQDVLSAHGTCIATLGNQNNELGVPATVLRADVDTRFVVVEMGMRGLHQLEELCEYVAPDMALVTNVGTSHMELLGSRENIARAKAEPFEALKPGGVAFINASDDYATKLREFGQTSREGVEEVFYDGSGADPARYASDLRPAVFASDIEVDGQGRPSFTLHMPSGQERCTLQMRGLHNVHNAAAVAAVGYKVGMDVRQVVCALEGSQPVAGRQRVILTASGITVVDDAYNANPDSMRASLAMFASMDVPGRRIAVLGDMGELGAYAEEGHASMGAFAASLPIARLVCVGELSRIIAQAARQAGMDPAAIAHVRDAGEALAFVKDELKEGDAVLVKASHSMALEQVVEGLAD